MSSSLASLTSSLPARLQHLAAGFSAHPYTASAVSFVALYSLAQVAADYRAWRAIGLGGIRSNIIGYAGARLFGLFGSSDLKTTHVYLDAEATTQYLPDDVPIRRGNNPVVSGWAIPVRQLSGRSPANLRQTLDEMLVRVVGSAASLSGTEKLAGSVDVSKAPSQLEGGYSSALFVGRRNDSSRGKIEAYHIHGFEGSAHARLSPADAKLLLDRGWGERHPLSGMLPTSGWQEALPLGFVMVYAPRDEEEIKVHEMAAKAAMAYAAENLS